MTTKKELLKKVGLDAAHIYDVVPSAIFTVDTQKKITSWNRRAEEISGYTQEEVLGKPCSIFGSKNCQNGCGLFSDNVTKPIQNKECDIWTKTGQKKIVSKNVDLLRNQDGQIVGGVECFEDITERKQAEEILKNQAEIVDIVDHSVYVLNDKLDYLYGNQSLLKRFKLDSLQSLVGQNYDRFHSTEETRALTEIINRIYAGGEALRLEYRRNNGDKDKFFRTFTPNKNQNDKVLSVTVISDENGPPAAGNIEKMEIICAYCKGIKNDDGRWEMLEAYFSRHFGTVFSHGICPTCSTEAYKQLGLVKKEITR